MIGFSSNFIKRIAWRCYGDYIMPTRLDKYRSLLALAKAKNYQSLTIEECARRIEDLSGSPDRRFLILRHDIDTDPACALEFHRIEQEFSFKASYYYRLRTLDYPSMQKIAAEGSEVSYHYEEMTDFVKETGIMDVEQIKKYMPEICARFAANLSRLRTQTGLPMLTVAAHGDFVSRRLNFRNTAVLCDPKFRAENGILAEAYDSAIISWFDYAVSDTSPPKYWDGEEPNYKVAHHNILYTLTHPRHWRCKQYENTIDNIVRMREELQVRYNSLFRKRL